MQTSPTTIRNTQIQRPKYPLKIQPQTALGHETSSSQLLTSWNVYFLPMMLYQTLKQRTEDDQIKKLIIAGENTTTVQDICAITANLL